MTKIASVPVIIGVGFGDEGKGLITDFEVRRLGASAVLRFNGGAQAGHTVVDGNHRHVFGHFSAGTFAGAKTVLGPQFIINPYVFMKEREALSFAGFHPTVIAHDDCPITTIYDMMINAMSEITRGENKHGSCGVGINETVTRHEFFPLTFRDVRQDTIVNLAATINVISRKWVPSRLAQLGITEEEFTKHFKFARDLHPFKLAQEIKSRVNLILPWTSNLKREIFVFEGAQGLQLDEELGIFPHVTRSKTGVPYAIEAAKLLDIEVVTPVYVTRCYATRHGAGPLLHENEQLGIQVTDTTNVENQWQGQQRYAPLDLTVLKEYITKDLHRTQSTEVITPSIAITHLDSITPSSALQVYGVGTNDKTIFTDASDITRAISLATKLPCSHQSFGPSAKDVCYKLNS